MVDSAPRSSEQEHLLGQALIQQEIPLVQDPYQPRGRPQDPTKGTFKEQNLLIVDKKKKFVPGNQSQHGAAQQTRDEEMGGTAEEGVLSIPPEDAPKNCKSKCPPPFLGSLVV